MGETAPQAPSDPVVVRRVRIILDEHPEEILKRAPLEDLTRTLNEVNWIIFGLVIWAGYGWLAPAYIVDDPIWFRWLLAGPIAGLVGGMLSTAVWAQTAQWLGGFRLRRHPAIADWWCRLIR